MTIEERANRFVGHEYEPEESVSITMVRSAFRAGARDLVAEAESAFCRVSCPAGCHLQKPFKCKRYMEFVKLIEE